MEVKVHSCHAKAGQEWESRTKTGKKEFRIGNKRGENKGIPALIGREVFFALQGQGGTLQRHREQSLQTAHEVW